MSNFFMKAKNKNTGEIVDITVIDNGYDYSYTYQASADQIEHFTEEEFDKSFERVKELSAKEEKISSKLAEQHQFPDPHFSEGCIKCGSFGEEPCEPPKKTIFVPPDYFKDCNFEVNVPTIKCSCGQEVLDTPTNRMNIKKPLTNADIKKKAREMFDDWFLKEQRVSYTNPTSPDMSVQETVLKGYEVDNRIQTFIDSIIDLTERELKVDQ